MLSSIVEKLAEELAAVGIAPDPLCEKLVGARIADRGEQEYQKLLEPIATNHVWLEIAEHHLGVGASLTDFLVSGIGLDTERRAEVASLGGLAHLIYAIFDSLLDRDGCAPALFGAKPPASSNPYLEPKQTFVIQLVEAYFERLDHSGLGTERARLLLEKAIRRLYQAEMDSAVPPASCRQVWWRKNALPIAVMGLPAWVGADSGRYIGLTEHVQWLVRVGEFFGWLDDFSDYEQDCASGDINRLTLEPAIPMDDLVKRVGQKGRRILEFWDARNRDSPARDTFKVLVWTWLTNQEA